MKTFRYVLGLCLCIVSTCAWAQLPTSPQPTSQPHATQPSSVSSPNKVFVGLKKLRRLLKPKKRYTYDGIVPLHAVYQAKWSQKTLRLAARLTVLKPHAKRSASLSLGGHNGVLLNVQVNGQRYIPRRSSSGTMWLTLPSAQPGRFTITYTYVIRIPSARGEHKLRLHLPQCAHSEMHVQFKGKGWEARTQPASQVQLSERKEGTYAHLHLPSVSKMWFIWKGKRVERREKTRFRGRIETLVTLQEGLLQGTSQVQLEILTGALRDVQLRLPRNVEVLHIGGAGVVEWFRLKNSAKHTVQYSTYTLQLSRAIRKTQKLWVRFERTQKGSRIQLPRITLPQAEQWSGVLGVQAKVDTEVSHDGAQNAQQMDVRSLSSAIRKRNNRPILLAYQVDQRPSTIHVKMVRHPRIKVLNTIINRAHFVTSRTRSGREVLKTTYWVTNNRRQFLPIRFPKQTRLLGAFVAGEPVQLAKTTARQTKALASQKDWKHFLIPLIRSSKRKSKRQFAIELLSSVPVKQLGKWGKVRTQLPATPIQILSYRWEYYVPNNHQVIWEDGSAQTSWRKQLWLRLIRRVESDLRADVPKLWAGSYKKRFKLNVYNSQGLKERFSSGLGLYGRYTRKRRYSRKKYRSKFKKAQWQVRAQMPLVGKRYRFFGHLVQNTSPYMDMWYIQTHISQYWFWIVWILTALTCALFIFTLLGPYSIRWSWVLGSMAVWVSLLTVGFFLPLTYLGGLRGVLFGVWLAVLLGLINMPRERQWCGDKFMRWARWCAVALTFLQLLVGSLSIQVLTMFLAVPIYPALIRRKKAKNSNRSPQSSPESDVESESSETNETDAEEVLETEEQEKKEGAQ